MSDFPQVGLNNRCTPSQPSDEAVWAGAALPARLNNSQEQVERHQDEKGVAVWDHAWSFLSGVKRSRAAGGTDAVKSRAREPAWTRASAKRLKCKCKMTGPGDLPARARVCVFVCVCFRFALDERGEEKKEKCVCAQEERNERRDLPSQK